MLFCIVKNCNKLLCFRQCEFARRAGSENVYLFGDEVSKLSEYGRYSDIAESKTHPGGKKKPNAWGLYDMHGNIREWVQDGYGEYPTNSVVYPTGPDNGEFRVLRGGTWFSNAWGVRSANRSWYDLLNRSRGDIGFRVARRLQ